MRRPCGKNRSRPSETGRCAGRFAGRMMHASFVRAPAGALGDRTETKAHERKRAERSESGKRRNPAVGPLAAYALDRGRRHLARPSHRLLCHRCEQPLRVVPPTTGWVTALAGLLARGSLPGRPAFPVSQWLTRTTGSPLTVAGAATAYCNVANDNNAATVFPLSSPMRPGEPARAE